MSFDHDKMILIYNIATSAVAFAAAVTALFPNQYSNKWLNKARSLLDLLAFNFGFAKNDKK